MVVTVSGMETDVIAVPSKALSRITVREESAAKVTAVIFARSANPSTPISVTYAGIATVPEQVKLDNETTVPVIVKVPPPEQLMGEA
jgi:hypothetical protein